MALGGARVGAGRKGYMHEIAVKELLEKSTRIIKCAFDKPDSELPFEVKLEVATRIILRAMPQKIEGDSLLTQVINVFRASDGHQAQEVSGPVHILRSPTSSVSVSLGDGKESLPDTASPETL